MDNHIANARRRGTKIDRMIRSYAKVVNLNKIWSSKIMDLALPMNTNLATVIWYTVKDAFETLRYPR